MVRGAVMSCASLEALDVSRAGASPVADEDLCELVARCDRLRCAYFDDSLLRVERSLPVSSMPATLTHLSVEATMATRAPDVASIRRLAGLRVLSVVLIDHGAGRGFDEEAVGAWFDAIEAIVRMRSEPSEQGESSETQSEEQPEEQPA